MTKTPKFQLHGYQIDFLRALAPVVNADDESGAMELIVQRCLQDEKVKAAIFEDFHCVHCGSVKPAEWIANRKGKKEPYGLNLSLEALNFLKKPLLVKVERVGDPPVKKIVEGALRADTDKAVRCCIDWAIKDYSA